MEKTKEAYNKMFMDMHNKYCLYFMDFADGRSSLGMNGYIISYNEDFELVLSKDGKN